MNVEIGMSIQRNGMLLSHKKEYITIFIPCPQRICSKTPSGCLKPWIIPNPKESLFASLWHIQMASSGTLVLWGHYWVKWGLLEHKYCDTETVDLRSKTLLTGSTYSVDTLSILARMEQNSTQLKTYKLCISGLFHLIFQTAVAHR